MTNHTLVEEAVERLRRYLNANSELHEATVIDNDDQEDSPTFGDLRTLLASLPTDDWQPIETAPKDGTLIQLWVEPSQPGLTIAAPTTGKELEDVVFGTYPHAKVGFYSIDRLAGWRKHDPDAPDWAGWSVANSKYQPTHWRPQPKAPADDRP